MQARPKAVAFDVDATSLFSLQEALPGWQIDVVHGASASSLAHAGHPGAVDLLVVGVRANGTETLGLCRVLAFGPPHAEGFRKELAELLAGEDGRRSPARRTDVPLLVLIAPGQEEIIGAALEAGAHSCLVL